MTARRSLLALGSAAIAAPSLPAIASSARVGPVEALCRQLPALTASYYATQDAMRSGMPEDEWRQHWEASLAGTTAIGRVERADMATPPETVADALLILALGASFAGTAADCDMNDEDSAEVFRSYARASRRAVEFLAEHHRQDVRGLLGRYYDDVESGA